MSAFSGASGSPAGGGMRAMTVSRTSRTPSPVLALTRSASCAGYADDVLDLRDDAFGLRLRQVDLVEDRHHLHALLGRGVAVGDGLRLDALRSVHHQQRALARRQRARHLVREVDVPRRVDQVEQIGLPVARAVVECSGLRLDRDAALALEVHRVEHLLLHLAVGQSPAQLYEAVGERGFAVVDVGDDGKIADMLHKRGLPLEPSLR